jgi:hypothetical protein
MPVNAPDERSLSKPNGVRCASLLVFVSLALVGLGSCTGASKPVAAASALSRNAVGLEVQCEQLMPAFRLDVGGQLPDADVNRLCTCIWNHLGGWDRTMASAFARGSEMEITPIHRRAFPGRFDQIIALCRPLIATS